jgi:hypothetical protein
MDSYERASWGPYLARMPPQSKPEHNWMTSAAASANFRQQVQDMSDSRANTPRHMDTEEVD